ncbi:phosphate ABC transporter, permease protein PstA [Chloroflexus islandicus]|uniref:Phosphate transport system permease protein PstA n=1 Tax=Chloroflexus islandicus TaxID=1707952 RepID=A0A178M883_9CHLR|nr:phosphate ABC transporter permease PstA [Chloroflexus islandicus]OAN44248.1 phosphate ABC transporter, permease protein PstA [Chloroflexus islandicus]
MSAQEQLGVKAQTVETSVDRGSGNLKWRHFKGKILTVLGWFSIIFGLGMLLVLILDVVNKATGIFSGGTNWLTWEFFNNFDSRFPARAGAKAAIYGTLYTITLTIFFAFPLGVAAAIYLEEYAKDNWFTRLVEINISNLAAVPSIIYGLLGLQVFVRWFAFGRSILAGALTLALLVVPIIIVASRESIRAVPSSLRQASYALGATRWQTVWHVVLPQSIGGILTGSILAVSRAIGETAPLITIGALTFVPFLPRNLFDVFTVLPIQIFNWTSRPNDDFRALAAAGILVLLAILLTINALAIYLRNRYQKRY